ncbi:hypothetical protein [Pseudalkalibacillus salsuginis]|uniref:hypothetical protein n=1 Tax=Pseudalkalibacillus salsuginis TaxID=2910972 RepID=UPI001F219733|nr:hypothetical protein [Pseudalkalibacillus salsuginis]MCF6408129.1 hypothetical protein [Pseudalkalibacillus salsuginis]
MKISDLIESLHEDIKNNPLQEVDEKYHQICINLSGSKLANEIRKVDLNDYISNLTNGLQTAFEIVQNTSAKAIYFEYDLDNDWDSTFFICDEYNPIEEEDDDWACDWIKDFEGPSLDCFSNIYLINGFDRNNKAIGATIYLIVRTVLSYAKAFEHLLISSPVPLCIAFHDQDPITRIKE